MRELVHSTGEFEGWDDAPQAALLTRLLQEAKLGVNKIFVVAVLLPAYREFDQRYQLTETIGGPYALAQTAAIGQTWDWLHRERHGQDGIAFAVAQGDNGQPKFLAMAKQEGMTVVVSPTRNAAGEAITPFQIADFIAWEYRRDYHGRLTKLHHIPPRPTMEAVRRTLPVKVNVCGEEFIAAYCEQHVPLRDQ